MPVGSISSGTARSAAANCDFSALVVGRLVEVGDSHFSHSCWPKVDDTGPARFKPDEDKVGVRRITLSYSRRKQRQSITATWTKSLIRHL